MVAADGFLRLRDELAAEVQLPVARFGFGEEPVRVRLARPEEVEDVVAARREELRDEAAVAPPP